MIRTAIIDDEYKSRETLNTLIERYTTDIEICGVAKNVHDGIKLIKEEKPELVFLDISLTDGNGFDIIEQCGDYKFELIFTTAHSEYAIQAIKQEALDYLLKPIDISELQTAVKKADERISNKKNSGNPKDKKSIIVNDHTIAIALGDGLKFMRLEDIISLHASGSYTEFHLTSSEKVLSSKSLKYYDNVLPDTYFFRTHHSYIINLSHIEQYHRSDGNIITMKGGIEVVLSRRKKKDFLAMFGS